MTNFNNSRYFDVLNYLRARVKGNHAEYMNGCIASGFAMERQNEITGDWLRRFLIEQVEDNFLNYMEALAYNKAYKPVIEEAKKIWK